MTSTPVSEEERKAKHKMAGNSQNNILRNNKEQQPAFRTAALKSQHQRWSFAESQLQQQHHQMLPPAHHYHPAYHQHQHYATYGHLHPHSQNSHPSSHSSHSSRRSSLASLYGTTHELGCVTHPLTRVERAGEGAYGYSVVRGGG